MGHVLLWFEHATFLVSAVLLILILTSRMRSRPGRALLKIGILLLPSLFYVPLALWAIISRFVAGVDVPVFVPVSPVVILWASYVALWIYVGRRQQAGRPLNLARPAMVCGVSLALMVMTFWNIDLAVRDDMSEMRLRAGAMALATAPPRVLDSDNAALVYELAFALIEDYPDWPSTSDRDVPLEKLRQIISDHQSAIAQLRRAAAMPGYYIDRPWHAPRLDWLLPQLGQARPASKLLIFDARLRLADGDITGALQNVQAVTRMAQHFGEEPLLVSALVAMSIHASALDELEQILPHATAADLKGFELSDTLSWDRHLRRALTMERTLGLMVFAQPEQLRMVGGDDQRMTFAVLSTPLYRVFALRDDLASSNRIWRAYLQAAAQPYYIAKPMWQGAEAELKSGVCGIVTGMLMPALSRSHETTTRNNALHELARTGLAMRKYQLKYRQLPANLDALVPEFLISIPRDPFADQPLSLKVTEDQTVLYSVGPDLVDDDGVAWNRESGKGDVMVNYRAKP